MQQVRKSERRSGVDRRIKATSAYDGPERRVLRHRRNGLDRRNGWPTVCVYCGNVCDTNKSYVQKVPTVEISVENQVGMCADCSAKKFPQFYSP